LLSKIQPYLVYIPGAMLETLELSESVNSADLVTIIILYLELWTFVVLAEGSYKQGGRRGRASRSLRFD
jgi:hypothetical protein